MVPRAAVTATPPEARRPVVVIDPGHAVDEVGAAAYGVVEKDSNLDMAVRVAGVLRLQGIDVILDIVEERAPDGFTDLDKVVPRAELEAIVARAAHYKRT